MMRDAFILSDERLEELGELYIANPQFRERGVLFDTFIRYPDELLAALAKTISPEQLAAQRALAQRAVRDRLDAQALSITRAMTDRAIRAVPAAVRRGEGFVEPLKHKVLPRRSHGRPSRHNPKTLESSR